MAIDQNLEKNLIRWAATREDEVVFNPQKGFYSFDIVLDAYEQGKKIGEKEGEKTYKQKARDIYFNNLEKTNLALSEMIKTLVEYPCTPTKVFINHTITDTILIIAIDPQIHCEKEFIDKAYAKALELQEQYHGQFNLDISFIDDTENLDLELLKDDGFAFQYDLEKNQPIM